MAYASVASFSIKCRVEEIVLRTSLKNCRKLINSFIYSVTGGRKKATVNYGQGDSSDSDF